MHHRRHAARAAGVAVTALEPSAKSLVCADSGVDLLDRIENPLQVSRLSHVISFLIDPVANKRVIPAKFFQQFNHLRCLLLAQERQLQDEMLAVLGELILTPLSDQYQDNHVERHQ